MPINCAYCACPIPAGVTRCPQCSAPASKLTPTTREALQIELGIGDVEARRGLAKSMRREAALLRKRYAVVGLASALSLAAGLGLQHLHDRLGSFVNLASIVGLVCWWRMRARAFSLEREAARVDLRL